jgi:hypothetical protein
VSEIRPEVVAGVLQGNPLAIENCTWAEQHEALRQKALQSIAIGRELLARIGVAAGPLSDEVCRDLTWRLVRPPSPHGATLAEAAGMWKQAVAYDAAMRLLVRWWPQPGLEDKSLGELLRLIPPDVADEVLDHLRRAGFADLPDGRS